MDIKEILLRGTKEEILAVFRFKTTDNNDLILLRFNLFVRFFFPKYFKHEDAPFHKEMDLNNLKVYKGEIKSFLDIAFRGGGKTLRTKMFVAFVIANDTDHSHRYFKVLTKDLANAKQSVTDIYNMFLESRVLSFYPEIFAKTTAKREERMNAFTTSTGIRITAGTVGVDQRGALQEDARPSFIWMDDIETRKTLRSAVETKAIFDNMEEARTGLSVNGGCVYTCNYISERGNVHRLIQKENPDNVVLIVPIIDKLGEPTWNLYSKEDVERIKRDADDMAGEYLCSPAAGINTLFDRASLDRMESIEPLRVISGLKIFKEYDPAHRYGAGQDIGGGIGLDASTNVIIDFDTIPAQVVATFYSNELRPDAFGLEVARHGERYGECLLAPENNKFDTVIAQLRDVYPLDKIFKMERKSTKVKGGQYTDYGFNMNTLTKPKIFFDLSKAVDDGLLLLNDINLINEAKSYSRDDLMDKEGDARLVTRHYDLLTSCCIAFLLREYAEFPKVQQQEENRQRQNRETRKGGEYSCL